MSTESRSNIWTLYTDYAGVFRRALNDIGAPKDLHGDLVHEFLVDRAPRALKSYQSSRGDMAPWLYVIFRRFALGRMRREKRWQNVLTELEHEPSHTTEPSPDLAKVRDAWATLSREHQAALRAYFTDGSFGEVARTLKTSPWRAKRLLVQAVALVALRLQLDIGVHPADLALLSHGAGDDQSILRAASRTGRSSKDARRAVREVRAAIAGLLDAA